MCSFQTRNVNISNYDTMAIVDIKRELYSDQDKTTVLLFGIPIYRKTEHRKIASRPPIGFQNGKEAK